MRADIRLYGILDPQIAKGRSLATLARAAAEGGTTILQYRAKSLDTRAMIAEAKSILAALEGMSVPLLINDRVDVALAAGAQGAHLGREDMLPADARKLMGEMAIIGSTVKNETDLASLRNQPIDYACIGGVFPTQHKNNVDPPLGIEGFRQLRDRARSELGTCPVGAIAGITLENAASLIEAGADGIAVIGALFSADDPALAARALRSTIGHQV